MAVFKVRISYDLLERQWIGTEMPIPRYAENLNTNLHIWDVLKPEVIEWIEENIKRKSAIKIRTVFERERASPRNINGRTSYIHFGTETDAVLFKLRWGEMVSEKTI